MNASSTTSPAWLRPVLLAIAALCMIGGIARAYILIARRGEGPDLDVLLFFVAAVVAMLADSISKFSFAGIEFERLKQQVDEIADVAMTQGAPVRTDPLPAASPTHARGTPTEARDVADESRFEASARSIESAIYAGNLSWDRDPVADRKSGKAGDGARLEAEVTPSKTKANVFKIDVRCVVPRRVLSEKTPRVAFFLHHTFPNRVRVLPVEGDSARLSLWSKSTFTIGALLTDETWLTLDLADADLSALKPAQREAFLKG
jgi:hypothetical protein